MRHATKCEIAGSVSSSNDSCIRYILQSVPASNRQIAGWASAPGCNFGVRQLIANATKSIHLGSIDIEDTKAVCFCLRFVARLRYVSWFGIKGLFPQGSTCNGRLAGALLARGPHYKPVREEMKMSANAKIEKFSARELLNLRNELLQSGIDSWQAAEVLSGFLTGRGYGVSAEHARNAITRLEGMGCNLDCMQAELENLAFVM